MIKPTFNNLSDEKRQRILNAAKGEFSDNSYSEVSINRIIKQADISRGSFYTYFDTKDDLAALLIYDDILEIEAMIKRSLKTSNGNLFDFAISLYDSSVEAEQRANRGRWLLTVYSEILRRPDEFSQTIIGRSLIKDKNRDIASSLDMSLLSVENSEDYMLLIDMILQLIHASTIKALSCTPEKLAEERSVFCKRLDFIKYGVLRQRRELDYA